MAKQEVAKVSNNAALPAHLQGTTKTAKIGNIDSTDLIIPRVKLLQAVSPEVTDFDNAKQGQFWHTILQECIGNEIRAIPIIVRKGYVLWAPRGDDRGILARADDAMHWDQPDGTVFEVKSKNSPAPVTYKLGSTVHDKVDGFPALSEFGSSIPGDPNSPPAASLTYQILWYFPDHPDLSPAVIINTRSSVKPAKALLSKIDLRPADHYYQQYKIGVVKEDNGGDAFFNFTYTADGYASEEDCSIAKGLFDRFSTTTWKANDEGDGDTDRNNAGDGSAHGDSKF